MSRKLSGNMIYYKIKNGYIAEMILLCYLWRKFRMNRKLNVKYLLEYILLFGVMFCAVFSVFCIEGKSFVRTSDGLNQYYYTLVYYGELLRSIIGNIGMHTQIPMWDMSIGYGSDILTTLSYYGVGDPINLICVFFDRNSMEVCYILLIIIRLFFAGIFFSMFSLKHNHSKMGSLIGSMIYVFSGFSLYLVMQYIGFGSALMYFPLVLIGVDRILEVKKPFFFIISIFLCAISNFYFFYMISIFMVLYAIFRFCYINKFVFSKKAEIISKVLRNIGRFAGYYAVGVLLALPILLPIIRVFLETGRSSMTYNVPFSYSWIRYIVIFVSFFWAYAGEYMGYTLLMLPVLVIAIFRKENIIFRVVVIVLAVMLGLPFFSSVFNGGTYVTTRWYFFVALTCAYLVAHFYEEIYRLKLQEKVIVAVFSVFINLLAYMIFRNNICFVFGGLTLVTIFIICSSRLNRKRIFRWLVVICSLGSIVLVSKMNYKSLESNNGVSNYIVYGSADKAYLSSTSGAVNNYIKNNIQVYNDLIGQYRYSKNDTWEFSELNASLINGLHGTQFYFSLYDENVAEFNERLYVNAMNDFKYEGVDSRCILLNLLNVKYIWGEKYAAGVYGFTPVYQTRDCTLMENQTDVSLGYTYSSYLKLEEWEALTATERQYAMLQTVFLEEDIEGQCNKAELVSVEQNNYEIPLLQMDAEFNILDENVWDIDNINDRVILELSENLQDISAEYYLVFEGLHYEKDNVTSSHIYFDTDNQKYQIYYLNANHSVYTDKHNFICNLGQLMCQNGKIYVSFEKEGVYTFDSIRLVCQPMEKVDSFLEKLYDEKLENVEINTNAITGNIFVSEHKILCVAVPYSDGWHAYVDGKEVKVYRANEMMMAIELEPGEHNIEFKYVTPGFSSGCIGATIGIILCIGIIYYQRKKGNIRNHENVRLNSKEA